MRFNELLVAHHTCCTGKETKRVTPATRQSSVNFW